MCSFFGKNASRSYFLTWYWVYLWGCPMGLLYWYWVNPTEVKTWNIQTIFEIWFGFQGETTSCSWEQKQRNDVYQLISMLFPLNQCWVDGGKIWQFHLAPLRDSGPNRYVLWHCFSVAKNSTNSTNSNRRVASNSTTVVLLENWVAWNLLGFSQQYHCGHPQFWGESFIFGPGASYLMAHLWYHAPKRHVGCWVSQWMWIKTQDI